MGRLIDADKLKDERRTLPMMSNWGEMLISLLIDEQPTAYDIDRVIEQLEKELWHISLKKQRNLKKNLVNT